MKDLTGLMKQAQQMQEAMQKAQAEIDALEVTGSSGGGMVQVTLSGKGEARRVAIDKSLMDPEEVEVLEDLVLAAMNDAKRKADEEGQKRMGDLTGGLANMLPPGFKNPFGG